MIGRQINNLSPESKTSPLTVSSPFPFCLGVDEMVDTGAVINQLLHHVGAMCIHQLNLLAASSQSLPMGPFLGKQHPMEARHFSSICDIMEKAMVNGDTCIIRCILVVFQVSRRLRSDQKQNH